MLSRSCFNLLNLVSDDDFSPSPRIPRIMTVPGVLSDFDSDSGTEYSIPPERRIVVSNQLPLKAYKDSESGKWNFEWDRDAVVFQLKDGFVTGVEVVYVGRLKAEIDPYDQDEVSKYLLDTFRCVPVFLPSEVENKFYHGLCKHYLWPLFHYMLPVLPNNGSRFNRDQWQAYLEANKVFSDRVMEVINPDEDYVWIHDYHLMVMPSFLRKSCNRIKLGFFLHSPFPSSEIYKTMPMREGILKALLNSDLIGFHTFDYARHFLSCCSRMLGLNYESKRGYISLDYFGRTVCIKILPVGIHMGQLESIMSLPETVEQVRELKRRFDGKIVMLGVDDMDLFKGISLKFLAMRQLLEKHPELLGEVVLVQILNPARSRGNDVQQVQNETRVLANEINERYGKDGYNPIVFIERFVSTQEKVAYYAVSECCVLTAVRDGMNLVPYKYTVCRQGSFPTDTCQSLTPKKSVIIVSEFVGCSPSLSGAIRVNPWNIDSITDAMNFAITMPEMEKKLRHEKHYKYVSSHDVTYWTRSFDSDLERACRDHFHKRCWGIGIGLGFRVVALAPNFRKLSMGHIETAYRNSNKRVILLDYDGTLIPEASVKNAPTSTVMSILNALCSDPNNTVFIVSGRGKGPLSEWFSSCEKLGISAEHGYFTRWPKSCRWECCGLAIDLNWKKIVEPVMEIYTETTDGSFIEKKESALVWHHQEADPDFGSCQALELSDHLENVLANEPVVVKRGHHIVEVKPQGVSKGSAIDHLISTMRKIGNSPDFVLCIGDDRSDEEMFDRLGRMVSNPTLPVISHVFACTVGQKPSLAKFYLDDTVEVIKVLKRIASKNLPTPTPTRLHATFERPF